MPQQSLSRSPIALLLCLIGWCPPLAGQATLSGIVRHDSTGAVLAGVEILINGTSHRTETAVDGRYSLGGLPSGVYQAIFRKVGYLPVRVDVRLASGETTRANTTLIESAVVLDPVIVTGTPETSRGVGIGREAFEERRKMGFGIFLDSAMIRRSEHRRLDDLLQGQLGIAISPQRAADGGRYILSGRRRAISGGFNCYMQVYLDGVPIGRGGVAGVSPINPVSTGMFPLSSLEKVEVYRSAAEVPGEYGGASAGCGVVLLWSRRGP